MGCTHVIILDVYSLSVTVCVNIRNNAIALIKAVFVNTSIKYIH